MERFWSGAQLFLLIAAELLAITALHALGQTMGIDWQDVPGWFEATALEPAIAALLRIVALGLAYWLAASTILYTLALASRIPSAIRAVEWATIPAVQRVARKAVSATLLASISASGFAAAVIEPPDHLFDARPPSDATVVAPGDRPVGLTDEGFLLPPGVSRPAYVPTPAPDQPSGDRIPAAPVAPATAQSDSDEAVPPPTSAMTEHEVVRGDNLWTIAAGHLGVMMGRTDLSDAEIAPYWARVVALNVDHLRSGNPDMIQPGEVVQLPPVESP